MIRLSQVLIGKPYPISGEIQFYQPTIEEIVDMGEDVYWSLTNLWMVQRRELVKHETEETSQLDDFEIWKHYVFSTPELKDLVRLSCEVLLKSKVEFFDISRTIYIGEKATGAFLDAGFYLLMKEICQKICPQSSASDEGQQYRETEHMSERERRLIEKMKMGQKKVEEIKNKNQVTPEDYLGNRILGLVAVGNYTFEQVYKMTMLQFNLLLQKYVDIQTFELRTALSPYISSDQQDQNSNKFWLD